MSVINACLGLYFLKSVWETLINFTQFLQHVGNIWLLFTSKNAVKLKYKRRRYVFVGFNRTHLIMLTISVIAAGQLNVNSWLSMLLRFIGIEYDCIKITMDLIALSKEGISL